MEEKILDLLEEICEDDIIREDINTVNKILELVKSKKQG